MAKTILAVDDSRTMREMIVFTLEGAGFEVMAAEDGNDALKVLGNQHVDAIITDLNMPNMNGFQLIEALRANPTYKFTPILVLTTESGDDKKQTGKAAGATGWIVKPFNPEKLISVVNKVCQ